MQIGSDVCGQREVGGGDGVFPRHAELGDFILCDGSPVPELGMILQDSDCCYSTFNELL